MSTPVRVRFAPSPTGFLHVGGLRTALYNYLFAKHNSGSFVLRIEDTDQSRKVEGAVENLIRTLQWAGVDYDEGPIKGGAFGPYVQSERLAMYRSHAEQLVEAGKAYYCFCSTERLDEVRKKQQAQKLPPSYDRHCRDIPREDSSARVKNGEAHVIRMKVPIGGELTFTDRIRGKVTIAHKILDDQVILKSDGFPTYHLAVVVDDHYMQISHVIRGEEWLPSTPKHILLYQYFGWEQPEFAHLPLLLNADKSKLSKRQGDVAVEDYRAKGFLKEALVNFIAFLGWNPGDEREIFSLQDLIKEFSLERVGKAGAVFNVEKLTWLNQQHLRLRPTAELALVVRELIQQKGWPIPDESYIIRAVDAMKERVTFVHDFVDFSGYLFVDPEVFDPEVRSKSWPDGSAVRIKTFSERLEGLSDFTHPQIEVILKGLAEELGIKAGQIVHPTRYALSGRSVGPGLYEMMELLGKGTVLRRLQAAVVHLG